MDGFWIGSGDPGLFYYSFEDKALHSVENLLGTYKMIGERLKHNFMDNEAWILSYREECFRQIGLKPSIKIPLYNGSLECEYRRYQMFDGKMKSFREEGGIIKTEEEKREMAQKHRFKKEREFKKRLDENEVNAEGDIRSFTFHSLEARYDDRKRNYKGSRGANERRAKFGDEDEYGKRFSRSGDKKTFESDRKFSSKRFDKNKKHSFRSKNSYNDED